MADSNDQITKIPHIVKGDKESANQMNVLIDAVNRRQNNVSAPTQINPVPRSPLTTLPLACDFVLTDSTVQTLNAPVIDTVQSAPGNKVLVIFGTQQDGVYQIPSLSQGGGYWRRIAKFNATYGTDSVPVFPYGSIITIFNGASSGSQYMVVPAGSPIAA